MGCQNYCHLERHDEKVGECSSAPAASTMRSTAQHVHGCEGCCSKIAEAEAAVSVNEKKCLVMHMHVQLKLDELRAPPNPWLTV